MKTVKVTIGAVFQNGESFRGYADIRLSQLVGTADRTVIVAMEPQRVPVHGRDAHVHLVPNSIVGEGTTYTIRLIREDPDRFFGEKVLLEVQAAVPDFDCRLADLVTGKLYPPSTLGYAQLDSLVLV